MLGDTALGEMIAAARARYGLSAEDVAKAAAPEVERVLKATASAGTDPEGRSWQPKKDGGRPLQGAAAAISVSTAGPVIRGVLTGPTVFHHFGTGKVPQRRVLPDAGAGIPPAIGAAILAVASRRFDAAVHGGTP